MSKYVMSNNEIKQACIYLSGRKGEKMEKNRTYEVVGISIYDGKSKKDDKPYRVHILEVDFEGKTAKSEHLQMNLSRLEIMSKLDWE